jgi:DNA-binding response OmpR family regulator
MEAPMAETEQTRWILVAEDDAALRSAWCEALEEQGYHTIEAADECEALDLLNQTIPDLILLDETLVGRQDPLRERDLLCGLIESSIPRAIPVLVMADAENPDSVIPGLKVIGRLRKSTEFQMLLAAVRTALEPVKMRE